MADASGPSTRTMAKAERPAGVAAATMVSEADIGWRKPWPSQGARGGEASGVIHPQKGWKGCAAEAQRSVIDVLNVRFERVPEGLLEKVQHEQNLAKLRNLLIHSLKASSLEAFASHLEG